MIQTGNTELDAIIKGLTEQRNAAMDTAAILQGKLTVQEQLNSELQKKFDEALKTHDST